VEQELQLQVMAIFLALEQIFQLSYDDDEKLYAVVASSTQTVNIIRQGSV
jgi:hypothetical protein